MSKTGCNEELTAIKFSAYICDLNFETFASAFVRFLILFLVARDLNFHLHRFIEQKKKQIKIYDLVICLFINNH